MIHRDRNVYLALLAPTLLVLLVFIVAPITQSIIFSFNRIIIGLPQVKSPFIGQTTKACDVSSLHWK